MMHNNLLKYKDKHKQLIETTQISTHYSFLLQAFQTEKYTNI